MVNIFLFLQIRSFVIAFMIRTIDCLKRQLDYNLKNVLFRSYFVTFGINVAQTQFRVIKCILVNRR